MAYEVDSMSFMVAIVSVQRLREYVSESGVRLLSGICGIWTVMLESAASEGCDSRPAFVSGWGAFSKKMAPGSEIGSIGYQRFEGYNIKVRRIGAFPRKTGWIGDSGVLMKAH